MSYQDIKKQLLIHESMLEENQQRSLQTDKIIRQFIGTLSAPLAKLLKIEENENSETNIVPKNTTPHPPANTNETNPNKNTEETQTRAIIGQARNASPNGNIPLSRMGSTQSAKY